MRNNEIITIKTKEIYCNAGDVIPLDTLGINIENANISKKTTFNYNAGGESVAEYIRYDAELNAFVVSQENAGNVQLVIRTSNKKYADFTISVHIGNGSVENPYYIFNETELQRIGSVYRLDRNYRLMSDITLTPNFKTIGYNQNTEAWEGFNGTFDGQGRTIKGLNINNLEAENAGLFSKIGADAVVKNLSVANATISGSYENAGVLAGVVEGNIEKIAIQNATISNASSDSATGSVAGKLSGNAKLTYAENVKINVDGTEEDLLNNVSIGGLIAEVNQSTVQACYANNVEINSVNSTGVAVGGLVGVLTIGTETGSIQQSYANTVCFHEHFGAFVGHILSSQGFEIEKSNMLRHLIGNFAVVYGVENSSQITDGQLVHGAVENLFVNTTNKANSAFYDKSSALYLIRGFASAGEVVNTNEYVFYAIDTLNLVNWDATYVWQISNISLPTLRMSNVNPSLPSGEYFRRDLEEITISNETDFINVFKNGVYNKKLKLLADLDLTTSELAFDLLYSTFNGNNKTIKINMSGNTVGLFKEVDDSTIKNLNVVVSNVSLNKEDAGAVAAIVRSSSANSLSTIENVVVTYENFSTSSINQFGGVVGELSIALLNNVKVNNLVVNTDSQVNILGAVVGTNEYSTISNVQVNNCKVQGTNIVGGVVGLNDGTLTDVNGNVEVYGNTARYIGGVVGLNYKNQYQPSSGGIIDNIDLGVNITIKSVNDTGYVGGVAGENESQISNVTISGNAIAVEQNNVTLIYIGGVVGVNVGTIENVVNNISSVGTYYLGANHYVGGVAASNSGTISKVLTQSDLNGNRVAGVVVNMDNSSAIIDQVVVGKYDAETKVLSKNEIRADAYAAGITVDFRNGTITNVQAASNITGETNTTRSSLVALIFPYGATLKNATIDSSLNGYGVRYREVWLDFAAYENKAEFGFEAGETGDSRFNLYKNDSHHGVMQHVVINIANEGIAQASASMGSAFAWGKDYQDSDESSFVKVVDGFNSATQFEGEYTFVCAVSAWFNIQHTATRTIQFAMGTIWEANNGIYLMFLDNIVE